MRKLAGLPADKLSELAGCTHAVVGHIESGRSRGANGDTLDRLTNVLGVSLDWLVKGVGEEPNELEVRAAVAMAVARIESEKGAA